METFALLTFGLFSMLVNETTTGTAARMGVVKDTRDL